MKQTIKQLQDKLDNMVADRDKYYSKYQELKDEKDNKLRSEMHQLRAEKDELVNQVRSLMEVIRWQINPETAKSPFNATKDQRDEGRPRIY